MPHIGLLNEKPLHASLKAWCLQPGDRVEAKVDALLIMQGKAGFEIMEKLDKHFLREGGHPEPHGHRELDDILGTLRQKGKEPA